MNFILICISLENQLKAIKLRYFRDSISISLPVFDVLMILTSKDYFCQEEESNSISFCIKVDSPQNFEENLESRSRVRIAFLRDARSLAGLDLKECLPDLGRVWRQSNVSNLMNLMASSDSEVVFLLPRSRKTCKFILSSFNFKVFD